MLYFIMQLLTIQLRKNGNDSHGKLRLNFHSLSVNVSELFEYGCWSFSWEIIRKNMQNIYC